MKFIATKNQNKKTDNHPDFRVYVKDDMGEVVTETYQKKDGTTGEGWKAFGAIWPNVKNGRIKSFMIDIDIDAVNAYLSGNDTTTQEKAEKPAQANSDASSRTPSPDYPANNGEEILF